MTETKITVRGKEVRYLNEDDPRARVDRADQIPSFADETEEQAWWGEHTLSEEFWRTAEPAPDDQLPPTRGPHPEAATTASASPERNISSKAAFLGGVIVGGALVAGTLFLVYKLMLEGGFSPSDFAPTRVSHLRISVPRTGVG